jgi:hypothetical protein
MTAFQHAMDAFIQLAIVAVFQHAAVALLSKLSATKVEHELPAVAQQPLASSPQSQPSTISVVEGELWVPRQHAT